MTDFAKRCRTAQECLPPGEYRDRLTALHRDMLAALDARENAITAALDTPGAERLKEWSDVGPAQSAALAEFARVLINAERSRAHMEKFGVPLPAGMKGDSNASR